MLIETENIVSMTQANQNFSSAAKTAEKNGYVVIFKNNKPKFLIMDFERFPELEALMSRDSLARFLRFNASIGEEGRRRLRVIRAKFREINDKLDLPAPQDE